MNKNARTILNKDRASKIKARLKEGYSVDEIKTAITNCSMTEWNMSNGVNDIEYICRNQQNLDKFADKKHSSQPVDQNSSDWGQNIGQPYLPNQSVQGLLNHE